MAKIANVALTDTFNTWRTRSNAVFDRMSQFAINNSSLYANTLTANSSFTSKGLATFNGRATVGTNLTVSGNTTLGAAGKVMTTSGAWTHTGALSTTNLTSTGNTVLGGTGKTITIGGATSTLTIGGAGHTSNTTGWVGVNGRASISTNLFVGGNTGLGVLASTYGVKLAVGGSGASSPQFAIAGPSAASGALSIYSNGSTTNDFRIGQGYASATDGIAFISNQNNADLVIRTNSIEKMRVAAGGLVTACNSMTVTQNLTVSGNTSVAGRLGVGLASSSVDQALHTYWTAASGTYLHVQHSGAYNSGVQHQNNQGSWYTYISAAGAYEIYGGTNVAIQFSVNLAGQTTVGRSLVVTNNLTVSGNTTLNGTTTDRSNQLSQTLTDGATINWDTSLGRVATVTLGAAGRTMAAPTNLKVGTYILRVYQDATGSRTITTWNSVFKWTAAVAPVLSTGANKLDIITFFSDGTNLYGSYLPDMR